MSKKIRIRSLGRIISSLDDFALYGVAGMVINGSLRVFWSTGVNATSTLEYGIEESDPSNFQAITESGLRKHHEIGFPTTFVDTYHYFRVRSTNPVTGVEKVSAVYRVYVTSTALITARIGYQPVLLEIEQIDTEREVVQTLNTQTIPTPKFETTTVTEVLADGEVLGHSNDKDLSPTTSTTMKTNYTLTIT